MSLLLHYESEAAAQAGAFTLTNSFEILVHTCDVLVRVPPTVHKDPETGWYMRARFVAAPKLYAEGRMLTCDTLFFEETIPEIS